jgi:hypothetical protein
VVEWTWVIVPGNFKEDTWVTSIEVKPSELAVTHHICLAYLPPDPRTVYHTPSARQVPRDDERWHGAGPSGAPGSGRTGAAPSPGRAAQPGGAGLQIPDQLFNPALGILARSNGLEECYEPGRMPADFRPFDAAKLMDPNWEAPPAVVTFDENVELVGLMPHMHVRGKSARFYLDYPDGRSDTALNVPRYDFNGRRCTFRPTAWWWTT